VAEHSLIGSALFYVCFVSAPLLLMKDAGFADSGLIIGWSFGAAGIATCSCLITVNLVAFAKNVSG